MEPRAPQILPFEFRIRAPMPCRIDRPSYGILTRECQRSAYTKFIKETRHGGRRETAGLALQRKMSRHREITTANRSSGRKHPRLERHVQVGKEEKERRKTEKQWEVEREDTLDV